MSGERAPGDGSPGLGHVASVLNDDACREIVTVLEEPMTAQEIAEKAQLPLSTAYKKLDRLTGASLVTETTGIRRGRHLTARYVTDFERIAIDLDEEGDFRIDIERPKTITSRELAGLLPPTGHET